MLVSILIVNWNSKDYLQKCLETVYATCGGMSPQVIVVDGGSFDGCDEMLARKFPEVEFVQSEGNIGFGRSNNLGFEQVTGEYLLLLNPDCEIQPEAVQIMLEKMNGLPSVGVLGPRLLNSDGSLQTSCVQSLPTPLNQALDAEILRRMFPKLWIWGNHGAFSEDEPTVVEAVSGACMLMRSAVFRQVGGFSPEYFMYGEDMDLCAKVRHLGLQNYHLPVASVIHHGGGSSSGAFSTVSTVFLRHSVFLFILEHHGLLQAWMYRSLMAVSSIIRLWLLVPLGLLKRPVAETDRWKSARKWLTILRWSVGCERSYLKFS